MATVAAPGQPGDEAEFVSLPDGQLVVEEAPPAFDATPLAAALDGMVVGPYRAVAFRRAELWAVGACSIQVVELRDDPGGDAVELVSAANGVSLRVDGVPSLEVLPQLEELGRARAPAHVVRARRLAGRLFELEIEAL